MTIAKDFASKLAVAFVAIAMIFMAVAPAVQAQETTEDLQKTINDLLAQVAALQAGGKATTSVGSCNFTVDLKSGSTGADVKALQQFLNADEDTRVAAAGAVGSAGMETEYYGPATAAAVSKFQVKYRAEILSPSGLVNPTGYFGPSSRAQANALCAGSSTDGDTDGDADGDTDGDDVELSGEADLDSVEVEDADDTTIEEGDEEVEVGVVNVEFTNGDAEISRVDIKLAGGNPWDAFESFSLWVDGDMVAEVDAARKADYLSSTNKTLRFSGLDIVAEEDEVLEITVAATVKSTVRNLASNDDWTLTVQSLRFFDADGVASTETAGVDSVIDGDADFTIEAEGTSDEAKIKKNSSNPEASSLKVDDGTKKSSEHEILVFSIEIDEESADTELNMAYATITLDNLGGKIFTQVVDTVKMEIDGKTVTGKAVGTPADSTLYEFDFKGLELAADDVYTGSVIVAFKGQNAGANYANGVTVEAIVDGESPAWELESVKTGDNVLEGSQSSKVHTLNGSDVTVSGYNWTVNNVGTLIDFTFTVEADDGDFDVLTSSIASTTSGNATITAGVLSVTGGDAIDNGGGSFTVEEGDLATFRVRYTVSGANGTSREVKITSVAGMNVPNDKQTSPTATVNVQ